MTDTTFQDRMLIREVYGRYALAAAEQNGDVWLGCWSANGLWKTPHFEVQGQQALRAQWSATWEAFTSVAAFNEVGSISVSGDAATATSSTLEIMQMKGGGAMKMAGLYRDEFVREDGAWRFAKRSYQMLFQE
jgi:ketosteroid isomerase-like protein